MHKKTIWIHTKSTRFLDIKTSSCMLFLTQKRIKANTMLNFSHLSKLVLLVIQILSTLLFFTLSNTAIAEPRYSLRIVPVPLPYQPGCRFPGCFKGTYTYPDTVVNINNKSDVSYNYSNLYQKSRRDTVPTVYNADYLFRGPSIDDFESGIYDINDNGIAVGKSLDKGLFFNFKKQDTKYLEKLLPQLPSPDNRIHYATSINNENVITGAGQLTENIYDDSGELLESGPYHAILYLRPDFYPLDLGTLGTSPNNNSYAQDVVSLINNINEEIHYVVGYSEIDSLNPLDTKVEHAFLYETGKELKDLGFDYAGDDNTISSRAYAINVNSTNDIMIVGSRDGDKNGAESPVLFFNDRVIELDNMNPPREGVALDINEKGQIVGWYNNSEGQKRGFLYEDEDFYDLENGKFYDLNDITSTNWVIIKATSINKHGQISGIKTQTLNYGSGPYILDPGLQNLKQLPSIVGPKSEQAVSSFEIVAKNDRWLVTLKNKNMLRIFENIGNHWQYSTEFPVETLESSNSNISLNNNSIVVASNSSVDLYTWVKGEQWDKINIIDILFNNSVQIPEKDADEPYYAAIDNNSLIISRRHYIFEGQRYNGQVWALEKIDNVWTCLNSDELTGVCNEIPPPADTPDGDYPSEVLFHQGKLFFTNIGTGSTIGGFFIKNDSQWVLQETIEFNHSLDLSIYPNYRMKSLNSVFSGNLLLQFYYSFPLTHNIFTGYTIVIFDLSGEYPRVSARIPVDEPILSFSFENSIITVTTKQHQLNQLRIFRKNELLNLWQEIYSEKIIADRSRYKTETLTLNTYFDNGVLMLPAFENSNTNSGSIKRYYLCDEKKETCETSDISHYDIEFINEEIAEPISKPQLEYKVRIHNSNIEPSKEYRLEVDFRILSTNENQFVDAINTKNCLNLPPKILCLMPPLESESFREITFYSNQGAYTGIHDIDFTLEPAFLDDNVLPIEQTYRKFVVENLPPDITLSYPPNDTENIIYILDGEDIFATYEITHWLRLFSGEKFSWYINEDHNGVSKSIIPIELSALEDGTHTLTLKLIDAFDVTTPIIEQTSFTIKSLQPYIDITLSDQKPIYNNPVDLPIKVDFDIPSRPFPEAGFKIKWWLNEIEQAILENVNSVEIDQTLLGTNTIKAELLPINEEQVTPKRYTDELQFDVQKAIDLSLSIDHDIKILAEHNQMTVYLTIDNSLIPEWTADSYSLESIIPLSFDVLAKPDECQQTDQLILCEFENLAHGESQEIQIVFTTIEENTYELGFLLNSDIDVNAENNSAKVIIDSKRPQLSIDYPDGDKIIDLQGSQALNTHFTLDNWDLDGSTSKIRWKLNLDEPVITEDTSQIITLTNPIQGENELLVELIDPTTDTTIAKDLQNFTINRILGPISNSDESEGTNNSASPTASPIIKIFNDRNVYEKLTNQKVKLDIVFSTNWFNEKNETPIKWSLYQMDNSVRAETSSTPMEENIIKEIKSLSFSHLDTGKYKLKLELLDANDEPIGVSEETEFEIVEAPIIATDKSEEKIEKAGTGPLFLFCGILFYLFRLSLNYRQITAYIMKY